MGWTITDDGKLQAKPKGRGRKIQYMGHLVRGLYYYLWPIYRRTFGDSARNPDPLRKHISTLLSPYFDSAEISPDRKGPIGSVIDKFVHRDKRAAVLFAEPDSADPLVPSLHQDQVSYPRNSAPARAAGAANEELARS
jgi:hypothetical protein